jgi:hypothetical protein
MGQKGGINRRMLGEATIRKLQYSCRAKDFIH